MKTPPLLWDDLRVLLAVHETNSFLGAAKVLNVSASTVARRVEVLEAGLGHRLVRRTAAGAEFEASAHELLRIAARTRQELVVAVRDAGPRDAAASMRGAVRVSLGSGYTPFVSRVVAAFRRSHPETTFELIVENRAADLSSREADVGLRTAKGEAKSIICRRAGPLRFGLYASKSYLAAHPPLEQGLDAHEFIAFEGDLTRDSTMQWLRRHGAERFPVRVSHSEAQVELAQCGAGIAAMPRLVATGRAGLVRVDGGKAPPDKSAFVAYRQDLRSVPRIRKFADAMTDALRLACDHDR